MKRKLSICKFSAFSVAEAMMSLLIVSLILAAMAPLFTKKATSNLYTETIPIGAIMLFNRANCPLGWEEPKELEGFRSVQTLFATSGFVSDSDSDSSEKFPVVLCIKK